MIKNCPEPVTKYLQKNLRATWNLEWNETTNINTVVVIPAICEFENIKSLLNSLSQNKKESLRNSLIIFVINNAISSNSEVKIDNHLSLEYLRSIIKKKITDLNQNQILECGMQIGLIDAASEGKAFEKKEAGVGLARKVGMDLALGVFDYSVISKKIIICLDADCLVEHNYLDETHKHFSQNNQSAALVDFEHKIPEEVRNKEGILSYEIFLRHYVAGLLFAKSQFAYHTIGSTIVCDHEAYIKVGGMNIKNAAEDFYFLQKLAKNFNLHKINTTKVYPSARESWRVPFGTGRSIADYKFRNKNILVFDPEVYKILKDWLILFNSNYLLDPDLILKESKNIHLEVYKFLETRNFKKDWIKILDNTKSDKQLDYQRINWFDAFETLKLIHHLRETSYPMLDAKEGTLALFKMAEYSIKFDLSKEVYKSMQFLEFLLSELKIFENAVYLNASI